MELFQIIPKSSTNNYNEYLYYLQVDQTVRVCLCTLLLSPFVLCFPKFFIYGNSQTTFGLPYDSRKQLRCNSPERLTVVYSLRMQLKNFYSDCQCAVNLLLLCIYFAACQKVSQNSAPTLSPASIGVCLVLVLLNPAIHHQLVGKV